MKLLAILAVLAVARGARADVVSSGPLEMRAPSEIVLGRDDAVTIRLRPGATTLIASTGTVDPPAASGGELRAQYHLPAEHSPRFAIVAALDGQGAIVDWLALPLAGQANVRTRTEPGASVVVRIAGHELPAVVADRGGVADVSITVPPGVHDALAIATGRGGRRSEQPLAFGSAPFARALVSCATSGDRVEVVAIAPDGSASTIAPVLTPASALSPSGPGRFAAALDASAPELPVTAAFAGEPATSCVLRRPPEAPSDASLTIASDHHVAGGAPIALQVSLAFPGRRTPVRPQIALAADLGTIDGSTWRLPDSFGGRRRASARLEVTWPGGHLERVVTIALVPGPPARIEASPPSRPLLADGKQRATIVVRVLDRYGNQLAPADLRARARGRLGPPLVRSDGTLALSYEAPLERSQGNDVVELSAGTASASTTVALVPLAKRFVVTAGLGYLTNLGRLSAPMATLTGEVRLPVLGEHLLAGVELGTYYGQFADASDQLEVRVTAVPALARLAYQLPVGRWAVWGGAGIGTVIATVATASPATGHARELAAQLAACAFAGGELHLARGAVTLELGYLDATVSSPSVRGRIGGVVISAGYALGL